ncbi:hypothetical protein DSO57_1031011 [Entomophthora muscae]|uniref:Uncharacterized protein n=1 Tax=Entomophthora muscae TaxID=34485 RepID=A0ACC2TBU1_9FUNG|nr:hypothetical protein DSO57_1031011 [Entomophthora muscae]
MPFTNQDRQGPASLPVEPNPGLQEIPCPNQEGQESASLPAAKTEGSIPALKIPESNPGPPKTNLATQDGQEPANLLNHRLELLNYPVNCYLAKRDFTNFHQIATNLMSLKTQDGWEPTKLVNHRLKLLNYSTTHRLDKEDSLNGCQIAAKMVPLKTQTYAEVGTCLKEVGTRPNTSPANEHQLLLVSSPEWAMQLVCLGDVVNSSGRIKHLHFFSLEQDQPGSAPSNP